MIVLPAIDLKDGACVRLRRGDFATTHQVAEDPIATANAFREAGAAWIHMVDLDGAKDGVRRNGEIVHAVAAQCGLQVELGGGIRTMADLEAVFALGAARAVIGSAAVTDPAFVAAAAKRYGEQIAVGVDAADGKVKTAGWVADSGLDYLEFAKNMEKLGVKWLIFTDIATDGMLSGPSLARLSALRSAVSCHVTASGGVANNQDIRALKAAGMDGAIVGKAYYAGTIDLAEAVKEAHA
ncbi:MAG: 1-(5-phosphoribosyl)-5-[(5-phosphoribosylamino)methylideneamino]imidazole-4-carboxamide isomerase [Oscillospiraceae bacterium]|nr:1-(5-phosphoribosyl)-5-[(5-phosphoribosylamino)methylideneamino]imidazole-4-carboxamide isomerase [Oscillospiraceae bacterium]